MLAVLSGRYGWRGVWLILVGTVWVIFGIGQMLSPIDPSPWVLHERIPTVWLAAGWWLTGLVAIGTGLRGNPHGVADDAVGHVALYLMPAARIVSYSFAWLVSVGGWLASRAGYDGAPVGDPTGWYSAIVWSLVSVMLAVCASWPNPQPPIPHPPGELLDDARHDSRGSEGDSA